VSIFAHMRRMLLPLAIVVAIVAIAVPTCRMVGCDMDMGAMGAMRIVPITGTHMSAACPGQWEFSSGVASIVPRGSDSLTLTLVAALFAAVVLFAPQVVARPVLARVSNPPPPPEEPRGERFRV
jgi:hypothetical protein